MEGASGLTASPGPPEQPASNPASRTAGHIILRIRRSVTVQGRSRGFTRALADECQCVGTGSPHRSRPSAASARLLRVRTSRSPRTAGFPAFLDQAADKFFILSTGHSTTGLDGIVEVTGNNVKMTRPIKDLVFDEK